VFYKEFHPTVEEAIQNSERKVGERLVGTDPVSGKPVYVKIGRFGPVAQIGSAEDEEKPKFASLKKDQHLETVTFEEVMELFKLPREIGDFEGKPMTVGLGRFGAYVRHDGKFVSLKKEDDPMTVSAERAVELIMAKREQEANRLIKSFEEDGIEICNGRFGPYIAFEGANYKIPKDKDPKELTADDCKALIKEQGEKKPKKKAAAKSTSTASSAKKPAATKKTAAKKTTAKKSTAKAEA
jgi:DNA topoisomerase-1